MTRRIPLALLWIAAFGAVSALSAQNKGPAELLRIQVPEAQRIAYGPDPLQFGELRVPPTKGPHPVVVLVHGGCWVAKLQNLDERAVALDLVRPLAAALTQNGVATWNLEYRRIGNPGGGWPGTFQDVAQGADYLRSISKRYDLDLRRVVAMGHSAGGQLALWLAARPNLPKTSQLYSKNPVRLKGVVDLDGPPDLKLLLPLQEKICGTPVITQLLGGTPEEQPEHYRQASPIEMLPLRVPQEVFAGRMFAGQIPAYEEAARRASDRVHATVQSDAGHFVFLDPDAAMFAEVIRRTRALLGLAYETR